MTTAAVTVTVDASYAAGPKYAGIVIDANSGNVLYSENADTLHYPASLTKMMTLYLTFEALAAGRIQLDTPVVFSRNAAVQAPTKLGVGSGHSITVQDCIYGIVTKSANDAAMALGEMLGGSEENFAGMMNAKARALGMTRTTYRNPNGLPNTAQMTTARDQARLGIALREHFPQYYGFFSTTSFRLGNRVIPGHNHLIGSVRGVDGIKTGYTHAAGYNLATSVKIDGRSIVGVVLGGASTPARDNQMRKLIAAYLPEASVGHHALSNAVAQVPAAIPNARAAGERMAASGRVKPMKTETAEIEDDGRPSSAAAFAAVTPKSGNPLTAQKKRPASEEIASIEPVAPASGASEAIDTITTASTPESDGRSAKARKAENAEKSEARSKIAKIEKGPKGWVVQIGVASSKDRADDLLDAAKSKGGKALRAAKAYAVAFDGGYRARFGGFDGEAAAVNACKTLKKSGVKCWASVE